MAISNHDLVGHFGVVHGLIQAKMESVEDLGFFETKTVDQIIVFELICLETQVYEIYY